MWNYTMYTKPLWFMRDNVHLVDMVINHYILKA